MTTERILTQDNLFALQCVVNYPAPSSPPTVPVQPLVVLFTVLFTKPTLLSLTPATSPPVPPTPPPSPREFQVPMDGSPVTVDFSGTDADDLMRGTIRLIFLNSVGNNCGVNVMLEFGQGYSYELEGILWLFPSQQAAESP